MVAELIAGVFLIAAIYILCRPGGDGQAFITAFGSAMSSLITQAVDLSDGAGDSSSTTNGN